ncbi:MAG: mechanosensitive ion channel family protein [Candidatus Cloacimonetes bacterium]|nr:mechanosensitive ion channel family protein [Candidatus Cloacimonadota bacterium]
MAELFTTIKVSIQDNNWYSLLFLFLGSLILYLITLKIILPILHYLIRKSPTNWDNMLIRRKVLEKLVLLPSLFFIGRFSYLLTDQQVVVERILNALFALIIMFALDRFLFAVNDVYEMLPSAKGKPIKGFIQVLQIIIFLFGGIIIIAILIERSPWILLSGLGAMTAVLLLIFRETILSFVASVRITSNRLIEIGDWIEMPQFGADGDVIDLALYSIQVQNWDKTIVSIPTHKLIDESFKNWKGMQQCGGRRIMRNINIDLESVRFCDEEMLAKFEKIGLLKEYLADKKNDISAHNRKLGIEETDFINGRHLTNIGTFRAYIERYLKRHPRINQNLIMMTRQMEPTSTGLPIQVYAFTNDTNWTVYESIQADIFDHLLAIVPEFNLRVFQYPSGYDLLQMKENIKSVT